jgi:hypothetical protein
METTGKRGGPGRKVRAACFSNPSDPVAQVVNLCRTPRHVAQVVNLWHIPPRSTGCQPVANPAARGCPCPIAGRSLRPSWASLARCFLRFAILAARRKQRRLRGTGSPSPRTSGGPRAVTSAVRASPEGEPAWHGEPRLHRAGSRLTGPWMARQPYIQCSRMPGRAPESGERR